MTEKKSTDQRSAKKKATAKKTAAKRPSKPASKGSKQERLGPGGLDKLVLGYMRRHKKDAPHTPSAVAKEIDQPLLAWRVRL